MYTYIYSCLGGCGPTGGADCLAAQLRVVGLHLPNRSLLRPTNFMVEQKGPIPGEFALQLKRSRRNSKDVTLDDEVFNKIVQCSRGLAIQKPTERTAVCLIKGVKMNGRPVSRGDVCVVTNFVHRRDHAHAGDTTSQGVCTVCCFYQIKCHDGHEVFADVIMVDTTHKIRSMFIMEKASVGLSDSSHTRARVFIHVDMIVQKMHIAPHFDDPTLVCGIPMWDTR